MKKLSKVVAGLSIAAAFGAAVLPLGAYAADKEVNLSVNVEGSISLLMSEVSDANIPVGTINATSLYTDLAFATTDVGGATLSMKATTATDINLTGTSSPANLINALVTSGALLEAGAMTGTSGGAYAWGIPTTAGSATGDSAASIGDLTTYTPSDAIPASGAWTIPTVSGTQVATTTSYNNSTEYVEDFDIYRVQFGIVTATDQVADEYTASVTYTLVNN
jgi:hypothetical protein